MAIQNIVVYPDPLLREISAPVTEFNDELRELVQDMADTMYDAPGIGLAAIQVGVPKRVVVMDLSKTRDQLEVFINPELTELGGTTQMEEGCLSVPGVYASVDRVEKVKIEAQDVNGIPFETDADELLSICIQHEVDHLEGKVFVDYLSRLKRDRVRRKLMKDQKQTEPAAV